MVVRTRTQGADVFQGPVVLEFRPEGPAYKRARLEGGVAPAAPGGGTLTSLAPNAAWPNAACPITLKPVMELQEPVKDATGVVYEREAVAWFLRALPARKRGRAATVLGSSHEVTLAELVPAAEVLQAKEQAAQRERRLAELEKRARLRAKRKWQQRQQQQQQQCYQDVAGNVVDLTGEPSSTLAFKAAAGRGGAAQGSQAEVAKAAPAAPAACGGRGGGTASTDAAIASQAAGAAAPASTGRHCGGGAASSKAAVNLAQRQDPKPVSRQATARAPPAAVAAAAAAAAEGRVQPKVPSPMLDLAKARGTRLTVRFGQRQPKQA